MPPKQGFIFWDIVYRWRRNIPKDCINKVWCLPAASLARLGPWFNEASNSGNDFPPYSSSSFIPRNSYRQSTRQKFGHPKYQTRRGRKFVGGFDDFVTMIIYLSPQCCTRPVDGSSSAAIFLEKYREEIKFKISPVSVFKVWLFLFHPLWISLTTSPA